MDKRKLLIVEDDPGLQKQLKWSFADYELEVVGDRESALEAVRRLEPPVVTLDLGLPPDPANASEGLAALGEILRIAPTTKIIVVTGNDDREVAVKAVGQGAYDFYEKPIDPDVLSLIVARAQRLHELEAENRRLAAAVREPLAGVIAGSTQMLEVCRRIEKIAPTDTTVLLLGESGTGKEVLARAIHELSPRRDRRFVAINCAAIPETLLESELFGYEKGAFTGAAKQTRGKLEYADGGTLFLDEMGDLPTPLQAKLLRFLQERVIERVGGREEIAVETRVVCATHKNIKTQIAQGQFREDLYYRISELTVQIPPLRERPGDSILIARVLLNRFRQANNAQVRDFSPAALAAIENYEWPGNVRELENRVKRAVIMADGPVIEPFDLELDPPASNGFRTLREIREEAEAAAIQQALAASAGQVGKAAEMLGVSRPTVYHLMKKFNIQG
jgi:two-component system NtrC family response regulator